MTVSHDAVPSIRQFQVLQLGDEGASLGIERLSRSVDHQPLPADRSERRAVSLNMQQSAGVESLNKVRPLDAHSTSGQEPTGFTGRLDCVDMPTLKELAPVPGV
jgi:hypothetical protein